MEIRQVHKSWLNNILRCFCPQHVTYNGVMTDESKNERTLQAAEGCWASILRALVPFGRLVTPSASVDPVVEIGLPGSRPQRDTSMISAYYLSFYE